MKKLMLSAVAALVAVAAFAQGGNTGDGGYDGDYKSLAERLLKLEKKTDGFNLYLNYGASYQESISGKDISGAFRAKQLRLEIKGTFGNHLSYRFRHRLNKSNAAMSEENFAKATDIMLVGWRFNDKFAIQAGKMCQWWGGFEFDENPMYIYQYSDLLDNMDNFLAGVAFIYNPVPSQEFVVNITNAYSGTFANEYGAHAKTAAGESLSAAAHPLSYILNWNGSFLGGMLKTRWSAGTYIQADKEAADGTKTLLTDKLVYLGQSLNFDKFQIYFDYMGNFEDLDRMRIATGTLGGDYQTDVHYNSFITKANWQFAPGFNLMGKFMYETTSTPQMKDLRTALGYIGSLEYYPMKDQDLRFFLAYVGRSYKFSSALAMPAYSTHRIELGLMYRIKCY